MALQIHGTHNIQAGTVQTSALSEGTGGGPKITSIAVTDSSYAVVDDTAVSLSGGYIKITGTGFSAGCQVVVGAAVATSVSFINSTEVRAQVPAQSAGTYTVYLVNSDGGVGIRVNGLNYSSTPTWTTTSPLGDGSIDNAISIQLAATSNSTVTYALQAGSTLPAGLSLSSSGLLTGTVTGITVDTTYNFTIVATDLENQDTPQAFSITITVSDPYFKNTVLLLQADTAPTIISDASANNFDLSVAGDARASNFTPYGGAWSNYFNASSKLTFSSAAMALGTGPFTLEFWAYQLGAYGYVFTQTQSGTNYFVINLDTNGLYFTATTSGGGTAVGGGSAPYNQWHHCAIVREGTGTNQTKIYLNGVVVGTTTNSMDFNIGWTPTIGSYTHVGNPYTFYGYLSNFRIVKSAVYTSAFTPPTQNLTAIANTTILTCADNRFLDKSTNAYSITVTSATITSFNPFNITNTGVNGSAYFDGTGDYITVPDNANLEPLGGNFTIETWFYLNAVTAGTQICGKSWWTPFYIEGSNLVTYLSSNGSTWDIASNQVIITSVATFRWYHVAMVRNGTSIKVYVNGTETLSLTSSAALHDGSDTLTIGARGTTYLNGYVADLRFVKGTAVYTANFTPPTQPLTAIANTQLLTLQYDQPHNNHGFQDSSSNQFLITRNGNATQGTFSPFSQSGWSNYFDGSSYLSAGTTLFNYTTGNASTTAFTIEAFVYLTSYQTPSQIYYAPCIISKGDIYLNFGVNGSGNLVFYHYDGSARPITGSTVISLNTWTYVAVTVTGGTATIYVNGTSVGSGTWYGIASAGQNTTSLIGRASTNASSLYFNGYISNLRVSTVARTITTLTAAYSNDANTALLTAQSNRFVDNGSSPITLTLTGSPSVQAFSPFAPAATYASDTNKGSLYLDGSNDYLTLPSTSRLDIPANTAFTVEFWIYLISDGAQPFSTWAGTATNYDYHGGAHIYNPGFDFSNTSGSVCRIYWYYGRYGAYSAAKYSSSTVPKRAWTHIAWCRDSSNGWHLFLNGVKQSLGTGINTGSPWSDGAAFPYGTNVWGIGDKSSGATDNYYLYGLKYIVGQALYTGANLTVPTSPTTSSTGTNLLCEFVAPAIADATGRNVIETVGDARTTSAVTKWAGQTSMRFDGTGDYLLARDTDLFELGSGNFTIESWVRFSSLPSTNGYQATILSKWTASNGSFIFYLYNNAGLYELYLSVSADGSTVVDLGVSWTPTVNVWYHVACVRSSSNLYFFVNGSQQGTTKTISTTLYNGTAPLEIGGFVNGSANTVLNGYLQDLRITKGYARYTTNFTPPATKFLSR